MCHLNSVRGSGSRCKSSTKSENKSSSDELTSLMGRSLNRGTNQDDHAADKDTNPSSISVGEKAAEGKCGNLTHVIDDEDHSRTRSSSAKSKGLLIGRHCVDTAHERRIWRCQLMQTIKKTFYIPKPFIVDTKYPTAMMKYNLIMFFDNSDGFWAAVAAARATEAAWT